MVAFRHVPGIGNCNDMHLGKGVRAKPMNGPARFGMKYAGGHPVELFFMYIKQRRQESPKRKAMLLDNLA